jgi:RHS repeat-associated protein
MLVPNRHESTDDYRYGFQGQEKDDEIKGDKGKSLNYTFRMHDPRVGRFFARDPLSTSYPHNSPYAFSENKVIQFVELEGLEVYLSKAQKLDYGKDQQGFEGHATFVANGGISAYNGLVDIWNYAARIDEAMIKKGGSQLSVNSAGADIIKNDVKRVVSNVQNYVANTTPKEFISTLGTALSSIDTYEDIFGGVLGAKGINEIGNLRTFVTKSVSTPWSVAKQSLSKKAILSALEVKEGATLYRIGTKGISNTGAEAQFWSLENPLLEPLKYSEKYNVPLKNIQNADFIETATLKKGAKFITREAGSATGSANIGKGIEAVIERGGTTNNVIKPIK